MSNQQKSFLINLTAAEMKKLLIARERIDVLVAEKEKLTRDLNKIETELTRLLDSAGQSSPSGPKKNKTGLKKKSARKKITKKKTTKKKVAPKATKKTVKKTKSKKGLSLKTRANEIKNTGRPKLEDVVAKVIKANGGPMSYKELISLIVKKKLFVSKSSNFDNVLRRTLSTSKLIKRVGRGVYSVA